MRAQHARGLAERRPPLLDVGGGTGNYAAALRDHGFTPSSGPGAPSSAASRPRMTEALAARVRS